MTEQPSEFTRPATWEDVKRLIVLLERESVQYALVGGYALAAHGMQRFTEDIDILVNPSPANTEKWIRALSQLPDRAAQELEGENDLFEKMGLYAVRINDEFTVDVLPSACGHSWEELAPNIQTVRVDGVDLNTLSLEGLLLTKEGMRPRDKADALMLRRALDALKP